MMYFIADVGLIEYMHTHNHIPVYSRLASECMVGNDAIMLISHYHRFWKFHYNNKQELTRLLYPKGYSNAEVPATTRIVSREEAVKILLWIHKVI